jgi:hypothetical protein
MEGGMYTASASEASALASGVRVVSLRGRLSGTGKASGARGRGSAFAGGRIDGIGVSATSITSS